ncbi:MAG: hypothetical protein IKC37_02675 [Clostridia bacterium]|nr:hypothetical protein [Clostridia bacterium]
MLGNLLAYYGSTYRSSTVDLIWLAYVIPLACVLVAVIIVFAIILPTKRRNRHRKWYRFRDAAIERKAQFENVLVGEKIRANVAYTVKQYYCRQSVDVFAFCADVHGKKLAVANFGDDSKTVILNFDEITGFSILDGKQNTVMDSVSVGGATGYGFGMASTRTNVLNTVSGVKLKIETKESYEPYMITIFSQEVNAGSNIYLEIMGNIEKMKSVMVKIIGDNEKAKAE